MKALVNEGFECLHQGAHTVLIRPAWKDSLLGDLMDDFRAVGDAERRAYGHGRVAHFSYRPRGSPGRVFVRHAARGGLIGAVLGGLYTSAQRPLRELDAAAAARRAGVPVPEPVAVRATRVGGLFWRFTVVAREIEDASDLLALAPRLPPAAKRDLIVRVADEMRRLHDAGVYHADLTMKNILLSGSSVYVIDLDKAILRPGRDESLAVMNLARLNRSIEKLFGRGGAITRADKLRFLRRYLGGRLPAPETPRDRIKELARVCAHGLWAHRLWWALSGQA
jgi:tRNA A-37 threonylcarbamoyl transferase component Bud32